MAALKTFSIQSGSNGNCIYVEAGEARLLFDAGVSGAVAQQRLAEKGRNIRDCDAVIISHDHVDHSRSAGVFHRKFGLPVYMSPLVWRAVRRSIGRVDDLRWYLPDETIRVKDVTVQTIRTPHDGVDTVCFVVEHGGRRLGIFTDLGHPFAALRDALAAVDAAYLESNFDVDMLWDGAYPEPLKQRIAGEGGHISNDEAADLVRRNVNGRMKWLALAHLSQDNNRPDLALDTVRRTAGRMFPVRLASRSEASAMMEV